MIALMAGINLGFGLSASKVISMPPEMSSFL
jgi:hypothetical protein